jgi:hypothetical protein
MPFESWLTLGRRILGISKASPWCIGDWLAYGQQFYGGRYKTALELTDFDYQTLRNYAWVSRRFLMSRRRDSLSFQHHAEVAALSEPEQELWLDRAQRENWSRNQLRRHIAIARTREEPAPPITIRVRVDRGREDRWRRAALASMQELDAWLVGVADGAAELALTAGPDSATP